MSEPNERNIPADALPAETLSTPDPPPARAPGTGEVKVVRVDKKPVVTSVSVPRGKRYDNPYFDEKRWTFTVDVETAKVMVATGSFEVAADSPTKLK